MNLIENIRIAFRALSANKLRSMLTMLGIIIGVAAVVALLSIGDGATKAITSQVEELGSNLISIVPGRIFERDGGSNNAQLYYSDYEALKDNLTDVRLMAPTYQSFTNIKYGDRTASVQVAGVVPEYAEVRAYEIDKGRFIIQSDRDLASQVAVLGAQTATDLFGRLNPVGQRIKINNLSFEIIGVLEEKGSGFGSVDDVILIPLETGYAKIFGVTAEQDGERLVSDISISADEPENVNDVIAQATFLLRKLHGLSAQSDADFTIVSQSQFLDTLNMISTTMTIFLGAIAAISLLVGGIGIMNIMLVSVTERTREIGLRKAVGAKRTTILLQFLVETLTLSLLGGLLGILLGASISYLFSALDLIQSVVSLNTVALAFFFASAVGLFFGIYPAVRASGLRPIEALRYE
jgi:putative ABC transport system permease protein